MLVPGIEGDKEEHMAAMKECFEETQEQRDLWQRVAEASTGSAAHWQQQQQQRKQQQQQQQRKQR
jgi:hypothetical protein